MALEAAGYREILIHLLIYSNKLAYLQLITVLVYGNSSPKSHEQDYLNFQQISFRGLLLPWNFFYAFTEHFFVYL